MGAAITVNLFDKVDIEELDQVVTKSRQAQAAMQMFDARNNAGGGGAGNALKNGTSGLVTSFVGGGGPGSGQRMQRLGAALHAVRALEDADFSTGSGTLHTLMQLKEPLGKVLPWLAKAGPAIQIATQAIGIAAESYRQTQAAQASIEQASRLFGAGQYGENAYKYAMRADRRGWFGSNDVGKAMQELDSAAGRAAELNRYDSGDRKVLDKAFEAAGGGQWKYQFFDLIDSKRDEEEKRLGRALRPDELKRQSREAVAAFANKMDPKKAEAFTAALNAEIEKKVATYSPPTARDLYQNEMTNQRARIYAHEGIPFVDKRYAPASGQLAETEYAADKDKNTTDYAKEAAEYNRKNPPPSVQRAVAAKVFVRAEEDEEGAPAERRPHREYDPHGMFTPKQVTAPEDIGNRGGSGWKTMFSAGGKEFKHVFNVKVEAE